MSGAFALCWIAKGRAVIRHVTSYVTWPRLLPATGEFVGQSACSWDKGVNWRCALRPCVVGSWCHVWRRLGRPLAGVPWPVGLRPAHTHRSATIVGQGCPHKVADCDTVCGVGWRPSPPARCVGVLGLAAGCGVSGCWVCVGVLSLIHI